MARPLMTLRAEVQRQAPGGMDLYGHALAAEAWVTVAPALPCRVWAPRAKPIGAPPGDADKRAHVVDMLCAVPLANDVRVSDRIAHVRDRLGRTRVAGPLLIIAIVPREQHTELHLRRVS